MDLATRLYLAARNNRANQLNPNTRAGGGLGSRPAGYHGSETKADLKNQLHPNFHNLSSQEQSESYQAESTIGFGGGNEWDGTEPDDDFAGTNYDEGAGDTDHDIMASYSHDDEENAHVVDEDSSGSDARSDDARWNGDADSETGSRDQHADYVAYYVEDDSEDGGGNNSTNDNSDDDVAGDGSDELAYYIARYFAGYFEDDGADDVASNSTDGSSDGGADYGGDDVEMDDGTDYENGEDFEHYEDLYSEKRRCG